MATPPVRGNSGSKGIFPLMLLLLLLLADLGYTEEHPQQAQPQPHPHRHAHNATTSATARIRARNQQRLQQLQWAQDANGFGPGPGQLPEQRHHHLRHEQHLRAELAANENRQPPVSARQPMQLELEQLAMIGGGRGQQHHLRHHNRHHASWEQRVFPELHQQQRLATTTASTTTTAAPVNSLQTDAPPPMGNGSIFSSSRYFDRDGIYPSWTQPRSTRAPNWQQQLVDSDEDDSADDDDDEDDADDEDYEDDAAAAELAKQMPRYSFFSQKLPEISINEPDYDQPESNVELTPMSNRHPSVAAGRTKAAAKRNIFDWLFKPNKEKAQTSTEKPKPKLEPQMNSDEAAYSNEQWNKIEHEHHLKQQQHQKELQALRESNRNKNAPLIRNTPATGRGAIDNEVSAVEKSLEDTNGHNADNSYSSNHIAGTLTAHKEKMLGTPEAVLLSRRQKEEAREKAYAHMEEVRNENGCHLPQKRWIRIERDPSKIYTPHCTSIYRCAEDSGCCPGLSEICAPKRTERIEKEFHVKVKNKRTFTETLTFVNHTECHCIERSNYYAEGVIANSVAGVQRATILSCNCPRHFERILQNDGQCRCDCSSSNIDCEFLKRGSEHFSMNDRKCIQQGRCKPPTCQFGEYLKKHGRCPRHQEQLPHQQVSYNSLGMS